MQFPQHRARRIRSSGVIRDLVRETRLNLKQMVMPYFVRPMNQDSCEIKSFPGVRQYSVRGLLKDVRKLVASGGESVLLFGVPQKKDLLGKESYSSQGIVQKAVRALKKEFPHLLVITDVCLCGYLKHGHCGVIRNGRILNDPSLKILAKVALSHAQAGADMVAPSDMMDGRVGAIRNELDRKGFDDTLILSYAAKFSSSFYGPFRDAAGSSPQFGDRKTYQMDFGNREEAIKEIALDIEEGADMVIVKPALAYLDIIHEARSRFSVPIAAYNVSGEYALAQLAAKEGLSDPQDLVLEILTAIHRAGARFIISYHTRQLAEWCRTGQVIL